MNTKTIYKVLLVSFVWAFLLVRPAQAFWIWTPESGKWVNPKYSVKPTPAEQRQYADSFMTSKQYKEALREYKKLIKHYPKSREAAQAQFGIGMVYEALGRYARAVDEYQMVIDKYPFSDLAPNVVERQYDIALELMEGKIQDSQLKAALLGTEHRVVEIFRKVIKNDPYGKLAAPSQYKIGLYYQARGEYVEARDEFEKTLNDFPGTKWADSAKYQIAVSDSKRSVDPQYDQQVTKVAVDGFKEFLATNPDSALSTDAQAQIDRLREKEAENAFVVAEFYKKNKKFTSARLYYKDVIEKYTGTVWADKAQAELDTLPEEGT